MDCNNYSYVNPSTKVNIIAQAMNGFAAPTVSLTAETNYFGDQYYCVSDLIGGFVGAYPYNRSGYRDAVKAYNLLVPDADMVSF